MEEFYCVIANRFVIKVKKKQKSYVLTVSLISTLFLLLRHKSFYSKKK